MSLDDLLLDKSVTRPGSLVSEVMPQQVPKNLSKFTGQSARLNKMVLKHWSLAGDDRVQAGRDEKKYVFLNLQNVMPECRSKLVFAQIAVTISVTRCWNKK